MTGADVGNNFFLKRSSIGQPRAEEVVNYLNELNSDVEGHALVKVSRLVWVAPWCKHVPVSRLTAALTLRYSCFACPLRRIWAMC